MTSRGPLLFRLVQFLVGFKLTPIGGAAVLGIFLSAFGGVTVEIPIYQIFCGVVCLFGIIEATGIIMRPHLRLSSSLPDKVVCGEQVQGTVTAQNAGWFPACDIMCVLFGMPRSLRHVDGNRCLRVIPRGASGTLPFTILAMQRGVYLLPEIRVHSTFPFNLMRFGKAKTSRHELRVLPQFTPLDRFSLPHARKMMTGEITVESRLGNSPDYVGNREYVYGEPAKRLDFKAWARVGRPIVREFQDEFSAEVALIFDPWSPGQRWHSKQHREAFEARVSLAAALAHAIDQGETTLDCLFLGDSEFPLLASARDSASEGVLDALAEAAPVSDDPLASLLDSLQTRLEQIAVVVCVLGTWDALRQALVEEIRSQGCAVKVFIVSASPQAVSQLDSTTDVRFLDVQQILRGEVHEL